MFSTRGLCGNGKNLAYFSLFENILGNYFLINLEIAIWNQIITLSFIKYK